MYREQGAKPPVSKIRIEIDDDTEMAARLRAFADKTQSAQRLYAEHYEALSDEDRAGLPVPVHSTVEQCWGHALRAGVEGLISGSRPPNSVLVINDTNSLRTYAKGECVELPPVCLPVGAEVIAIETSKEDGPNLFVGAFTFGSMNLIEWSGCGRVPLSTFRFVTRHDLLSVFDHKKTIVDVQVRASLLCKKDGATFDGFRLHLHLEEQFYQIANRIENVECDHPESAVYPIVFSDARTHHYFGPVYMQGSLQFRPTGGPIGERVLLKRYRCTRCGRLVVRDSEVSDQAPPVLPSRS